ncbi:hypothetical protein PoB_004568600 [Plakobranchus ocellatus]|uniref:IBB domain-containing protein n=1 Tax=Plakobranchus ocellatus TaxID=259542 RepID=A0AAV4B740_9GAST|nr:hypothetical protein PoB_004568600 [Plakobranchus ocellatus]
MKFRFFKLQPSRRRSASCPNLEQAGLRDDTTCGTSAELRDESSSESEAERESVNKFERLQAQKSTRRLRQKEKEKQENVEKSQSDMLTLDT